MRWYFAHVACACLWLPGSLGLAELAAEAELAEVEVIPVAAESDSAPAVTPMDALAWTVGDWTDAEGTGRVDVSCRWAKNEHFITREFRVGDGEGGVLMAGTQVIGWDPALQQHRSWTFDSEGGFGEAYWTQDGDRWLIKKTFTLVTGERASALNVLTRIDDNTATWASVNREVDGRVLPNQLEVTIVRAAPEE